MGNNKLTEKQDAFARDVANKKYKYIWEAYAANYNAKDSSKNVLYVNSCKLLANAKVALRIKEIEDRIQAKEKVTLDEIIVKLSQRVNMDIRGMFDDDSCMKGIKELTKEQAMFINSFDVQEIWGASGDSKGKVKIGVLKKVKLESIKDMLDMLIRHYGGYAKDNKQKGSGISEAIKEVIAQSIKD